MPLILHIAERVAWEQALRTGRYAPASLAAEGFIHASTKAQLLETANRRYRGRTGLVVLCIDRRLLEAPLRFEAAAGDPSGDERGGLFPHVYGALVTRAVVDVIDLVPGPDGKFAMPARLIRK